MSSASGDMLQADVRRLETALANGASGLVVDVELPDALAVPSGVSLHRVSDARAIFGAYAHTFHGEPSQRMPVIGVTGTNGKTTTTQLLAQLGEIQNGAAASLGTLGVFWGREKRADSAYTTPLAHDLATTLADLAQKGAHAVAMEVSSHALALDRVAGLTLAAGVVTNVTRDHLDFHGTPAAYAAAKRRLLEMLPPEAPVILNADDPGAVALVPAARGPVWWYGIENEDATLRAIDLEIGPNGSRFNVILRGKERFVVRTPLVGRFQVSNILAALTTWTALGADLNVLCETVTAVPPVPGRMQAVALPNGATGLVDYAHNPDGLRNLLANCRELPHQRVRVVFGAGGDRDRGKRPEMAAIAAAGADYVYLTSDNPRTEDSQQILDDLACGLPADFPAHMEPDRARAIEQAYAESQAGDLLVVAGKGHEDYQIIGTTKHPFSDVAVLAGLA